jgi:hypothetical protein
MSLAACNNWTTCRIDRSERTSCQKFIVGNRAPIPRTVAARPACCWSIMPGLTSGQETIKLGSVFRPLQGQGSKGASSEEAISDAWVARNGWPIRLVVHPLSGPQARLLPPVDHRRPGDELTTFAASSPFTANPDRCKLSPPVPKTAS